MDNQDASTRADHLLEAARDRRPRWRHSELRRAPGWFRGQELNLVDERERLALYVDNEVRRTTQPWLAVVLALPALPSLVRELREGVDPGFWIGLAVAWGLLVVGGLFLRRRNIVASARRSLRESADWPQRLDAARTPPAGAAAEA